MEMVIETCGEINMETGVQKEVGKQQAGGEWATRTSEVDMEGGRTEER